MFRSTCPEPLLKLLEDWGFEPPLYFIWPFPLHIMSIIKPITSKHPNRTQFWVWAPPLHFGQFELVPNRGVIPAPLPPTHPSPPNDASGPYTKQNHNHLINSYIPASSVQSNLHVQFEDRSFPSIFRVRQAKDVPQRFSSEGNQERDQTCQANNSGHVWNFSSAS